MKPTPIIFLLLITCAFGKEPLFLLHEIDRQQTESIMVMDFDGDGRLDVGSGAFWYRAPDWTVARDSSPVSRATRDERLRVADGKFTRRALAGKTLDALRME